MNDPLVFLMLSRQRFTRTGWIPLFCFLLITASAIAGYKPRQWSPRSREDYPARLTSEKVTIAADPLLSDTLAAQVFDKSDMVTAGIMPLGIVIFNDNDYAVKVQANSIEVIGDSDRVQTLAPFQAVSELFKGGRGKKYGVPDSRMPGARDSGNPEALRDFEVKFLGAKVVPAHGKEGGFLYIHPPTKDLRSFLSKARLYVPDVYREDNGGRLIFFEFDLKPAVDVQPSK